MSCMFWSKEFTPFVAQRNFIHSGARVIYHFVDKEDKLNEITRCSYIS
jgi:hypothetical protein